jgi:hypothetical protein
MALDVRKSGAPSHHSKFPRFRLQAIDNRAVLTTKRMEGRGTNRSPQASKQPNRDLPV